MAIIIEDIANEYGITLNEELTTAEALEVIESTIKDRLLNNADFIAGIPIEKLPKEHFTAAEIASQKRYQGEAKKAVMESLGLKEEDLVGLTEDQRKNNNQLIKSAIAIYKEKFGNTPPDVIALQNQLTQLAEENEGLKLTINDLPLKLQAEFDTKQQALSFASDVQLQIEALRDSLHGLPRAHLPNVLNNHVGNYEWRKVDGDYKAFQKDKPDFFVTNPDTKKQLTLAECVKNGLIKDGLIKQTIEPAKPASFKMDGGGQPNGTYQNNKAMQDALDKEAALIQA
jgi:regulator of replication initiation timing